MKEKSARSPVVRLRAAHDGDVLYFVGHHTANVLLAAQVAGRVVTATRVYVIHPRTLQGYQAVRVVVLGRCTPQPRRGRGRGQDTTGA